MGFPRRRLLILGATGSVGRQALDLLARSGNPLDVVGLSAHRSAEALALAAKSHPQARTWLTQDRHAVQDLLAFLGQENNWDLCLNAAVGAAGLPYSEAVLRSGRDLALANKESLVLAGHLLVPLAQQTGAALLPVDSEHAAIQQCVAGRDPQEIRTIFLTASGGALRDRDPSDLASATPQDALAHPNWDMGPRITVDSATMMNKAFEILEANHLFGLPGRQVQVLLHRQSILHALVEFQDGAVLSQMGPPDMAFPLHFALHAPHSVPAPMTGFDATLFARLDLEVPDPQRWPALELGWKATEMGSAAGAILNAADEVAVQAFLEERLPFPEIVATCAATLEEFGNQSAPDLAAVLEADATARDFASSLHSTAS